MRRKEPKRFIYGKSRNMKVEAREADRRRAAIEKEQIKNGTYKPKERPHGMDIFSDYEE